MVGWTGAGAGARRALRVALLTLLLGAGADRAFADLTVFAGSTTTGPRTTFGAALGLSLQPVGVEFEYGGTPADRIAGRPALRTGLFNLLVGTSSTDRRVQVYGSFGGGMYRERLEGPARTGLAASAGGGIYVRLNGPFRVRFDYRLFVLRGDSAHRRSRRAYAALNVAF